MRILTRNGERRGLWVFAVAAGAVACGARDHDVPRFYRTDLKRVASRASTAATITPVPPPPFSEGVYPCSECHSDPKETNPTRRVLTEEHKHIVLQHGPRDGWCYECHNPDDRDKLRLASGRLIDFKESYLLCGQCHGPTLRDWRLGIHGKRTGSWSGEKRYLLCVHCHVPHAPRFRPLKPEPRPLKPSEIRP